MDVRAPDETTATIERPQTVSACRPTTPLRVTPDDRGVDLPGAAAAVRDLLRSLGQDPESPHLSDTPRRVAEAIHELLTPRAFDLTTFPNEESYDDLVLARSIPFQSLCEHHLLPFRGVAHVGYLPGNRILGLSKLARVVELFAHRLQVQERLTVQIAGCKSTLNPRASESCSKQNTSACRCAVPRPTAATP